MTELETPKTGASLNRGRSKQDYGTPWPFVRAVEKRFGPIVRDLAASEANAKAPLYYDEARDSLTVPWAQENPEGNLWLNPPYANIGAWAEKCALESVVRHGPMPSSRRGLILLLTPASIGTDWFAEFVHRRALVLGLSPRLTFEGTSDPYPKDLMLSVFGMGINGFDVWRWS